MPSIFHPFRSCLAAVTLLLILVACLASPTHVFGAFGLTTATDFYTVDTGGGLVFKVRRTDNGVSTQSAGDLMSLVYNGVEYQDLSRGSQVNSGCDFLYNGVTNVTVSAAVVSVNYIRITVRAGNLTHYYMARNGYPHIYMATHFSTEPETQALCRFIVRIPDNLLSNGPAPSDIRGNTGAIESGDIFGMADGTTRSKHYSNMRLMDWSYIGATGSSVGVFMLRSNHEGDSGGPFYRSLLNQCGDDQEITYILNYGEAQTEAFRTNILNGPYTLVFTGGGQPSTNVDYSWIESAGLNLTNWVSNSARGAVAGTVSGVPNGFQAVVGFANGQAQYWALAATNGSYTTPLMIPGTYTATLYKQELAVATDSVTVTAGVSNTLNLASTEVTPTYIWKLGEWDGTPTGFLNADKITTMHPSDVRMSNWLAGSFIVESNTVSQFPCVQFRGTNSPGVIKFNLTAGQITTLTLRIGTTCAYNGGRPQVSISTYTSPIPAAPSQPSTRSITVGTYRENNYLYTYTIPASALVVGQNTLYLSPVSGSSDLGPWLSAGWVYDAIELDIPVAGTWNGSVSTNWNTAGNWTGGVPSGGNATINTTTPRIATISADVTTQPIDLFVGSVSGNTGRLDQIAGSTSLKFWAYIGVYGANGTYNLANTTTTGGALTGFGQGAGRYLVGGDFWIGQDTGSIGRVNMNTSGKLSVAGYFHCGGNSGTGKFYLDAGTVSVTGDARFGNNDFWVGNHAGSGELNMSGGSFTAHIVGFSMNFSNAYTTTGSATVSGGTLSSEEWFTLGFAGNNNLAAVTNNGGTINVKTVGPGGNLEMTVFDTSRAIFTVNSGAVNLLNNASIIYGAGGNNTGTSSFNQNGGAVTFYSDAGTTVGGTGTLNLAAGNGTYTYHLNGGTLTVPGISKSSAGSGTFNFNGGTLKPTAANASYMGGLTTANVRNGGAIFDTAGQTITIGQALVHSVIGGDNATDGGLVKLGTGTLTLSGTNTYTGSTTISNGALKINVPALADTANVIIASTGTLELNFVGTDIVNGLVINGVVKSPGTYGATGSGAANIDDAHFAGPGVLQVGTAPSPASIVPNRNGDQLILTWPTGAGWRLQKQTNSTAIGLRTNWLDVVGATPPYTNSVSAVDPTVFFRLAYP